MSDTMEAVVDHRPETSPVPRPGPGEALVQVEAVGICASDLKCYCGGATFWGDDTRPARAENEVTPGHEFVGRLVEIDQAAAQRWGMAVGDRVTSEQIVWMCAPHDIYGFNAAPGRDG